MDPTPAVPSSGDATGGPPAHPAPGSRPAPVVAAVALGAAAAVVGALTWTLGRRGHTVVSQWAAWASAGASVDAVRVDDAVALVATALATALSGWFALGCAVAAGCAAARATGGPWLAGERLVARCAPVVVRRALAVSTGTGLVLAGAAGVATAVTPEPPEHLGWTVTSEPPAGAAPPGPGAHVVTVRPGDTLWGIARAHLPSDATTADVAAAWPAWFAANHAVVGPDPDLILPGQELVEPSPTPSGVTGADR